VPHAGLRSINACRHGPRSVHNEVPKDRRLPGSSLAPALFPAPAPRVRKTAEREAAEVVFHGRRFGDCPSKIGVPASCSSYSGGGPLGHGGVLPHATALVAKETDARMPTQARTMMRAYQV